MWKHAVAASVAAFGILLPFSSVSLAQNAGRGAPACNAPSAAPGVPASKPAAPTPAPAPASSPAPAASPATTPTSAPAAQTASPVTKPAAPQPLGQAFGVAPAFTLEELIDIARRENQALAAVRAQALAARAGIATARAIPNPELEILGGQFRARAPGTLSGSGSTVGISQRIENPALREARRGTAQAFAAGADISIRVAENEMATRIKTSFFEVMRREEELAASIEDVNLTEQIRERIRVRTRTGEGARFDLLRAEAEVAIATKERERAEARLRASRAGLRADVGFALPDNYSLLGEFYRSAPSANYDTLRAAMVAGNPELQRALADINRAERQVEVERQSVLPSVSLRIAQDREPDMVATRAGIALSIPLFDRRRGPIDEARAQVLRSKSESESRRLILAQSFEAAWQQYQASLRTVRALEGGIIAQSRQVVEIAEAAYRFGERGILELLDARRQFRLVRGELIGARFDLYAAKAELERLAATDIKEELKEELK
jgi:outer membrane protein, heavy metal efflux system